MVSTVVVDNKEVHDVIGVSNMIEFSKQDVDTDKRDLDEVAR